MKINKAIRKIMRDENVTLTKMAKAIGKEKGNAVSSRLSNQNMTTSKAVEMLNVLGYELVIQKRKSGSIRDGQIVIDQLDENLQELLE